MKFTLVKDLRQDPLMRPLLAGVLLFIALYLASDVYVKSELIGVSLPAAQVTFTGDEESFVEPISLTTLIEIVHGELFFMMLTLMTLCTIYARLRGGSRGARVLIHLTMLSALLSQAALVGAQMVSAELAVAWVTLFWCWHAAAFWMGTSALLALGRA